MARNHPLLEVGDGVEDGAHQRRVDVARANRIDPDAVFGVFQGRRFGQADDAVLGRHIRRRAGGGNQPHNRGGVDDGPAALRQHLRQFRFHRQPDAFQIDAQHPVEIRLRVVGGQRAARRAGNAGVVESAIQPSVGRHRLRHHRLRRRRVRHIGRHQDSLAAGLFDELHRFLAALGVHIGHRHPGALPGIDQAGRPPDAGTAAGYQGRLPLKLPRH